MRASAELAFEEARILRDWLEGIERLLSDGCAADRLAGDVAVVCEGDPADVVLIRSGQLLGSQSMARTDDGDRLASLVDLFHLDDSSTSVEAGGPTARRIRNDETWMLARWIGQTDCRTIDRASGEADESFAERILETAMYHTRPRSYSEDPAAPLSGV